jgi:putative ABC transport system permease protein
MTAYYAGTENLNSAVGELYIELDDPDYIDYLIDEIRKTNGVLWDGVEFSTNDDSVDFITQSIENVEMLTDKVILISGISALAILSLLMLISLKERQYEVGVLLSIGETKTGIIVQLLAEMIVIAVLAFILSSGVSFLAAGVLGDALINNQQSASVSINNLGTNVLNAGVLLKSYLSGIVIILISTVAPSFFMMMKNPKTILLHDD